MLLIALNQEHFFRLSEHLFCSHREQIFPCFLSKFQVRKCHETHVDIDK
jgi:hypothetical protein